MGWMVFEGMDIWYGLGLPDWSYLLVTMSRSEASIMLLLSPFASRDHHRCMYMLFAAGFMLSGADHMQARDHGCSCMGPGGMDETHASNV